MNEVGRCLLSATISNAGEVGNTAVIKHFKPVIRANTKEVHDAIEQKRLTEEIREEFEMFFKLANTSLLKAKLSQQRQQNKKLIEKLKQNRKKVHQNLINTVYNNNNKSTYSNSGHSTTQKSNMAIKRGGGKDVVEGRREQKKQQDFLSSISDVGIHAIKTNFKNILMQHSNRKEQDTVTNQNSNTCAEKHHNNNKNVEDSDNESIASSTSTMTAMTDESSTNNDSAVVNNAKMLFSKYKKTRHQKNKLTMGETLLLRHLNRQQKQL